MAAKAAPSPTQKHHLLPLSLVRRAQIGAMLTELKGHGFSIHDNSNLLNLPADENLAWLMGAALHRGPHPAYTDVVAARLERIRIAGGTGKAAQMLRLRRIQRLQRALKRILSGGPQRLLWLNRRDPLHFFADYSAIDSAIAGIDWTPLPDQ